MEKGSERAQRLVKLASRGHADVAEAAAASSQPKQVIWKRDEAEELSKEQTDRRPTCRGRRAHRDIRKCRAHERSGA